MLFRTVLGLAVALTAAPSWAQGPRPGRPYRGLFAGSSPDISQSLTVGGSVGTGFDDDLNANARGVRGSSTADEGARRSGTLGNLSAGVNYTFDNGSQSINASAGTSARYYPSSDEPFVRSSQGQVALRSPLGVRNAISASLSVAQQPYSFMSLFPVIPPDGVEDAAPDLGPAVGTSSDASHLAATGDVGFSHQLSQRTSASANYGYRVATEAGQGDLFVRQSAGGGISYALARGLSLRAGYGYSEARHPDDAEPLVNHSIDAGITYGRALSFSRRTSLSFGTGSSGTTNGSGSLHMRATGNATLLHEIGRTWRAAVAYGRGVILNESWREPVMSDSLSVMVSGLVTRRVQFTSLVQGALGTVGTNHDAGAFDNYYATSSLSTAFTRFMKASVSYSYYHHRFDEGVLLPAGAPRTASRQSVSANISLWAPVFQRVRRQ
jgi:hypothetical protein